MLHGKMLWVAGVDARRLCIPLSGEPHFPRWVHCGGEPDLVYCEVCGRTHPDVPEGLEFGDHEIVEKLVAEV